MGDIKRGDINAGILNNSSVDLSRMNHAFKVRSTKLSSTYTLLNELKHVIFNVHYLYSYSFQCIIIAEIVKFFIQINVGDF